jgi:hypothetical protein
VIARVDRKSASGNPSHDLREAMMPRFLIADSGQRETIWG